MRTVIKQTVDTSENDRDFIKRFEQETALLAGLTIEIIQDDPRMLLSPTIRTMLVDRALQVQAMLRKLQGRLACDNPGKEDLQQPHTPLEG